MARVFNFGAGPATIPLEVLEEAQENLVDYKGEGMSIMEASHRSKMFDDVHMEALALIRKLYLVPEDFEILFMQGGASMQFALVPLNLAKDGIAQYINSGVWSQKAIKEAEILKINYEVLKSSYEHIPKNLNLNDKADYVHITSNNTIYGTQYKEFPKTKAPLVIDASSDIFSYEVDWSKIDLMYAGAQKNAGPSGVTIVIIKKDLLSRSSENTPSMFRYKTYADNNSLYNTPPTFGIYMLNLTMKWIKKQGGIKSLQKANEKKAKLIYDAIDNSEGFYIGYAKKDSRSLMNISFNIRDTKLESEFIDFATKSGLIGLKGHRSVGGIRASIYNAMSFEGVQTLVEFMEKFASEKSS
jgi:phosphoserine aminotransferase